MQPFEGTPVETILHTKAARELDVSLDLEAKSTASINELLHDKKNNKSHSTDEENEDNKEISQEDTEESDQESISSEREKTQ
jgi:hypothetical protein